MTPAADALLAANAVAALERAGQSVAVAESLTGGAICAALSAIPGASTVFLGGVISYATDVKRDVLGVTAGLLADHGPVHPLVAVQMAQGVSRLCRAPVAVATTGVAGPGPHDGHDAGEAFIGWTSESGAGALHVRVAGDRDDVIAGVRDAALHVIAQCAQHGSVIDPGDLGRVRTHVVLPAADA